ncbi:hypothetical protein ACLOJK_039228 [Asimina triloba]
MNQAASPLAVHGSSKEGHGPLDQPHRHPVRPSSVCQLATKTPPRPTASSIQRAPRPVKAAAADTPADPKSSGHQQNPTAMANLKSAHHPNQIESSIHHASSDHSRKRPQESRIQAPLQGSDNAHFHLRPDPAALTPKSAATYSVREHPSMATQSRQVSHATHISKSAKIVSKASFLIRNPASSVFVGIKREDGAVASRANPSR